MVIITGTSRGIGKALAENYLANGKKVIGISRNHTIIHANYTAVACDLSNPDSIEQLAFTNLKSEELIFIHNAGILGEVNYFEKLRADEPHRVMQVNLFAGATILHQLLRLTPKDLPFKAVFISSGAGKNPIASWAAYCASKAAVDMFCQVIQLEEYQLGRTAFNCLSVAPGVVDTEMQARIRSVNQDVFSEVARFQEYKLSDQLYSPKLVSQKLYKLLHHTKLTQVIYSLKDID
ncbi:SDR family NAD(P)-dependent oxidoreductase [Fluviicola sp.]|jgi:benzil reductase ((S)-benzoin forming)|uniref:SDR family NAD(P)-dependent oxidoreductase n=1 Tax=Fluviicola sp. TaxID=1917219 RepID=UPI00282DB91E|nr:SDR family NAD(P)-dependent oxidoreductase [Fluviicola sp.]MDR0802690.1 SDR family NAD(P)-dependent oxidoreductase [Fluviicola sp.]